MFVRLEGLGVMGEDHIAIFSIKSLFDVVVRIEHCGWIIGQVLPLRERENIPGATDTSHQNVVARQENFFPRFSSPISRAPR